MKTISYDNTNSLCSNSTTQIFSEDKQQSPLGKNTEHYSQEKHVCATCNEEIDYEISRVMLMRDKDGGPRLLCFHFFFPCWDFDLLIQKYPNLVIDHAGFSIPENIRMKESSIRDLQKNLEFWNYPSQKIL
jgi:hypothetical protein